MYALGEHVVGQVGAVRERPRDEVRARGGELVAGGGGVTSCCCCRRRRRVRRKSGKERK